MPTRGESFGVSGGGSIVVTDYAAQQAATGKSAAETVAATNRAVATGRDTSGKLANDFDNGVYHPTPQAATQPPYPNNRPINKRLKIN